MCAARGVRVAGGARLAALRFKADVLAACKALAYPSARALAPLNKPRARSQ